MTESNVVLKEPDYNDIKTSFLVPFDIIKNTEFELVLKFDIDQVNKAYGSYDILKDKVLTKVANKLNVILGMIGNDHLKSIYKNVLLVKFIK